MTDLVLEALPGLVLVTVWGLGFLAWCGSSPERLVWTLVTAIFLWMFGGIYVMWRAFIETEGEFP